MTEAIEAEFEERNLKRQRPLVTHPEKINTPNKLRHQRDKPQQIQTNLSSIDRARKFRTGEKRGTRKVIERIFGELGDGRTRSTSKLAKDTDTAWTTTYWALDLIEYIQSQPHLSRDPNTRRKRFYQLLAPGRRR